MLKRILAGAMAVTLAAALSVPAQAQLSMQKPVYDVNVGLVVPFGDLGDVSNVGFNVGADGFLWSTSDKTIQIGGRVAYNNFGSKDYNIGWGTDVTSDASIIEIVPTARYQFKTSGPIGLFAQAGAGLYLKSAKVDAGAWGGETSDSETDFGITIGGGATYTLSNGMQLMAMPLFHLTGDNYLTVNVGVLFGK